MESKKADNLNYDKIIIGAGLYGLYSALFCGKNNEKVLVLEKEDAPFKRATYINQARVHMGYHYFLPLLNPPIILKDLIKTMVFLFFLILIKFMLLVLNFHGLMRNNLKSFVKTLI